MAKAVKIHNEISLSRSNEVRASLFYLGRYILLVSNTEGREAFLWRVSPANHPTVHVVHNREGITVHNSLSLSKQDHLFDCEPRKRQSLCVRAIHLLRGVVLGVLPFVHCVNQE